MKNNQYIIQVAKIEDLSFFQQFGLFQVYKGYQNYLELTPNGMLVGRLNGQLISKVFCLKFQNKYAYVGGYFVREQYRKKGYGTLLFNKLMELLKDCQIVKLNSKDDQVDNYQKWGFRTYQRQIFCQTYEIPSIDINSENTTNITNNKQQINIKEIIQFDYNFFGINKNILLHNNLSNNYPFVSYHKVTNQILGYSCLAKDIKKNLWRIIYLIAVNDDVANDLLKQIFKLVKILKLQSSQPLKLFINCPEGRLNFMKRWFPMIDNSYHAMYINRGGDINKFTHNVYGIMKL